MIPQGFGLMREVFDDEEFDKATGMFGLAIGLPLIAAPILADANLWGTGWRLVLLIKVPIGLVSFVLALRTLPRGASHSGMKLDVGGVWLIGLSLVAIIYPLIQGQSDGWPAWTFVLLATGLVLLLVFLTWKKRRKSDALDLGLAGTGGLWALLWRWIAPCGSTTARGCPRQGRPFPVCQRRTRPLLLSRGSAVDAMRSRRARMLAGSQRYGGEAPLCRLARMMPARCNGHSYSFAEVVWFIVVSFTLNPDLVT
jgi:MFS family permease